MTNFQHILKILTEAALSVKFINVNGDEKIIKAMVRLTSEHYYPSAYIKIIFQDDSFMLLMLDDQEIYYADKILGKAPGISDKMIGQKTLQYNGKEYRLANKNDYQYVLQLLIGSPTDIEGECRFSDYFPVKGPKEFLSLGWLSRTGERVDINPKIISTDNVSC